MKNKLLIIALIAIMAVGLYQLSEKIIPEKIAKDALVAALKDVQTPPGREKTSLIAPPSLTAVKNVYMTKDWPEDVITWPVSLKSREVKYIGRQFVSRDMVIYYITGQAAGENQVKIEARVLLEKGQHQWIVKSIMIDAVTKSIPQPSFLIY